jgi:hypothetical protein
MNKEGLMASPLALTLLITAIVATFAAGCSVIFVLHILRLRAEIAYVVTANPSFSWEWYATYICAHLKDNDRYFVVVFPADTAATRLEHMDKRVTQRINRLLDVTVCPPFLTQRHDYVAQVRVTTLTDH